MLPPTMAPNPSWPCLSPGESDRGQTKRCLARGCQMLPGPTHMQCNHTRTAPPRGPTSSRRVSCAQRTKDGHGQSCWRAVWYLSHSNHGLAEQGLDGLASRGRRILLASRAWTSWMAPAPAAAKLAVLWAQERITAGQFCGLASLSWSVGV